METVRKLGEIMISFNIKISQDKISYLFHLTNVAHTHAQFQNIDS